MELRNGYDRLDRLTAKGPNHKEFIEPKVQGLWRVVLESQFSPEERASLKVNIHINTYYIIEKNYIIDFIYHSTNSGCNKSYITENNYPKPNNIIRKIDIMLMII